MVAEISTLEKETTLTVLEEALLKLNKEGDVILAQTGASHIPLPEIRENLDWTATYNEAKANRI